MTAKDNHLWKFKGVSTLRSGLVALVDFVLPPRCPESGEIVDMPGSISPDVWQGLRFITAPFCNGCGMPFPFESGDAAALCLACVQEHPPFRSARAALAYDDRSRNLILRFKHADQTHTVYSFIPWLRLAGRTMLGDTDVIVPVPLHPGRLLNRRYNQAALLAQALARAVEKPWLPDTLRRVKATPTQGFLKAHEREKNVRRAFAVPEKKRPAIAGRKIILIDDVYTTGATVSECTKTLLKAGAQSVDVLTVARVVRD